MSEETTFHGTKIIKLRDRNSLSREHCSSYLLYWFLNGWKYDKSGVPEVLEDIPITEKLSRACEIAAFSNLKKISCVRLALDFRG